MQNNTTMKPMENKIQINGVWYVREDSFTKKEEEAIELNPTYFKGCAVEIKDYCWEATKIEREDGTYYGGVDIQFTDKTVKPWKDEHWDNEKWMVGVYKNDPESLVIAKETMSDEGIKHFQAFVGFLIEKGWLD